MATIGLLSTTDADLAPIRPLIAQPTPGVDLTRLGSWCLLPICCGAFAGQSISRKMTVFECIQPWDHLMRLMVGEIPPEVHAHTFAAVLKEWMQDPAGEALARLRLTNAFKSKGKAAEDIPPCLMSWTRLSIMLNNATGLDTDTFMPLRAWADGNTDRWLELSFATGLLLSVDDDFPYEQLANGEVARQHEPNQSAVRELFHLLARGRR